MWLAIPLLTVTWVLGLLFGLHLDVAHRPYGLAAAVGVAVVASVWPGGRHRAVLAFGVAAFVVGLLVAPWTWDRRNATLPESMREVEGLWIADVADGARPADREFTLVLDLVARVEPDGARRPVRARVVAARVQASWLPAAGDRVLLRGRLAPHPPPMHTYAWDPATMAATFGIHGRLHDASAPFLIGATPGWRRTIDRFRIRVERAILTRTSQPAAGVIVAMVTGSRGLMDREVMLRFGASGIAHVLAVSGMHLVMLAAAMRWAVRSVVRRIPWLTSRWSAAQVAAAVVMPTVVAYVVFTGSPASGVRAGVMSVAMLGAELIHRRASGAHALCLATLTMTLVEPLMVMDLGFQLSASATGALVALSWVETRRRAEGLVPPQGELPRWRRLADMVWTSLKVSQAATFATAPFLLWSFGQTPVLSPLANLLVAPPVGTVALPAGAAGALLDSAGLPWLGWVGHQVAWASTALSIWLSEVFDPWFSVSLTWGRPGWWGLLGWCLLAVWTPLAGLMRWRTIGMWTVASLGLLSLDVPPSVRHDGSLQIHAVPVGQGDCSVVVLPDGTTMLVDAGGVPGRDASTGSRYVLPWLRLNGLAEPRIVVATHADADHVGGVLELLPWLRPEAVWVAQPDETRGADRALVRLTAARGASLVAARPEGEVRSVGGARVYVLPTDRQGTDNHGSLVLRVCHDGVCALLTGDIEADRERWLAEHAAAWLRADYLKVPHHGSRTSSTDALLDAVRPKVAVMHLGAGNRFGFPHAEVAARYRSRGIGVWRTDGGRAPVWSTDGGDWTMERR